MPEITFYVATFAEAVNRAARVAPTKGVPFDKAHGILLEYKHRDEEVTLRSNDLQVSYREVINDVVRIDADHDFAWRIPSQLFDGIVRNMPLDGELILSHTTGDGHVHMKCGRKKANLMLSSDADAFPEHDFPEVDDRFIAADGLGNRLKQVGWACDRTNPLLAGVHFDGEVMSATDKYKLVKVPFKLGIDDPVTVPLSMLSSVLTNLPGKFRLYSEDKKLYLSIGDEIQIISIVLDGEFPPVDKIPDAPSDYKFKVDVPREHLSEMINNQLVLVKNDRYPRVQLDLRENELMVAMFIPGVGDMEDFISVNWDEDDLHIEFTPEYLTKALSGTDSKAVTLFFNGGKKLMMIKDDADYTAWVQPRSES